MVANETVAGKSLIDALRSRAADGPIRVTVICPQNEPRAGFVVYEDSRRSSAERRLRRTLDLLHEAGIAARGAVVDPDPLQAIKDAIYEYDPDEIIISTHPGELKSELAAREPVERARKVTDKPVDHVVVDLESPRERAHVLVLANQTILGQPLLDAIHERARGRARRLHAAHPRRRGRRRASAHRASGRLMAEAGIEATGRLGDPDPVVAVENAIHDEQIDEIIVSTFPEATSGWLRRDVLGRIRSFGLPVTHVVVTPAGGRGGEESAVA